MQPPPATGGASLDYNVVNNWGSGFTGAVTGSAGLNGWTVSFDSSAAITHIWNAVIASHVGNHYVIRNADWNAQAAPGSTIAFGFQATSTDGDTRRRASRSTAPRSARRRPRHRPSPWPTARRSRAAAAYKTSPSP
jgi:Cellulose binding domain